MTKPTTPLPPTHGTSTRPYLIRALHDWCTDNGFTPYVAVYVDETVRVPMEYVKNNEIVLNVGFEATSSLKLGNEFIEFKARFGGVAREIAVPVDHVVAIYARENGQGMAFPVPTGLGGGTAAPAPIGGPDTSATPIDQPLRGLRLASSEVQTPVGSPDEGPPEPPDQPPPPVPPKPSGSGPASIAANGVKRPSLKRVK